MPAGDVHPMCNGRTLNVHLPPRSQERFAEAGTFCRSDSADWSGAVLPSAMSDRPDRPEEDHPKSEWAGPSRSQKKRDVRAVADIGRLLTKLSPSQLAKVPVDDELREAIVWCQALKKNAYARQLRYIAKRLNAPHTDLDPIKAALRLLRVLK
jgi:hypothetical protein